MLVNQGGYAMSNVYNRDRSSETAVEQFTHFVEAHCTMYDRPEGRPDPNEPVTLGIGRYVLRRLPGTPFENVQVIMTVTEEHDTDEDEPALQHSIIYEYSPDETIMTLDCEPRGYHRPFYVANGGDIGTSNVDQSAILAVIGDITAWENSGDMVPDNS